MNKIKIFDKYSAQYDNWFNENKHIYQSELKAIKHFIPKDKKGLEVGVGTGRFAGPLGIKYGIEPSEKMAEIATQMGIKIYKGIAEKLPFKDKSFDFVLFVTSVCFLNDIKKAFIEVKRVLKKNGLVIIGLIDKNSSMGRQYLKKKKVNRFYKSAKSYSVDEIIVRLKEVGFYNFSVIQTIFDTENKYHRFRKGFGKGLFAVIKAVKEPSH